MPGVHVSVHAGVTRPYESIVYVAVVVPFGSDGQHVMYMFERLSGHKAPAGRDEHGVTTDVNFVLHCAAQLPPDNDEYTGVPFVIGGQQNMFPCGSFTSM